MVHEIRQYRVLRLAFAFLLLSPFTAQAQDSLPPKLRLPLDCMSGQTCWLVNYPDADPAPDSAKDFTCGPLSYDGHDGSDFGVRDLVTMETGVPVVAAADGTVLRQRDGAEDQMPSRDDIRNLLAERKGCGNGIVIEHADGWQTLYCHMKQDSLRVKEGQPVKAGETIGLVGHSGAAEFPHLHFTIMKDGIIYDPFTGLKSDSPCQGMENAPLWEPPLTYEPVSLYAAGLQSGIPDMEALKIDAAAKKELRQGDTNILTFWIMIYGAAAGDKIQMEITGPDNVSLARQEIIQEKTRVRQFYYIGKDFRKSPPPSGNYKGTVNLYRAGPDGKEITRTREASIQVN